MADLDEGALQRDDLGWAEEEGGAAVRAKIEGLVAAVGGGVREEDVEAAGASWAVPFGANLDEVAAARAGGGGGAASTRAGGGGGVSLRMVVDREGGEY